jgi:hypothetical protein
MSSAVPPPSPTRKPKRIEPQRHRWFDPWLIPRGEVFGQIMAQLAAEIEAFRLDPQGGNRRRRRKPEDEARFYVILSAVVANLAYMRLMPPETGRLATNTRNGSGRSSRYDHPEFSTMFRDVLGALHVLDYIDRSTPKPIRGEAGSIAPTSKWKNLLRDLKFTFADFFRDHAQEVIVLSRKRGGDRSWLASRSGSRERVEYLDTRETRRLRNQMRQINAFLTTSDITFEEDGLFPPVDPFERLLRRYYVLRPKQEEPHFDQSGRLFGGFWLNLRSDRRRGIRINGEPTVTLDYGSMFTRLAYAALEETPPTGDLYAIPDLQGYRSGVKMAMNVFLFDETSRRSRWPKEMGVGVGSDDDVERQPDSEAARYDARLPAGWTVAKAKRAILEKHPHLAEAWGRGLGYRLMNLESDILVMVLLDLMEQGIPALGLHDGLMVQASKKEEAIAAMEKASIKKAGISIPVGEK